MIKWLKRFLKEWEQIEHESIRAGIVHTFNPWSGIHTYIDQETYKKYLDDKQRTIQKDNKDS